MQEPDSAPPDNADEGALIERARSDPHAFGALFDRHTTSIYRFVYTRVPDTAAAGEITSQVFARALGDVADHRAADGPVSMWLQRIAVELIADRRRHDGHVP